MTKSLSILYLAFSVLGGIYLAGSLSLPLGTGINPGPGFFPILVGILILCLSIPAFIHSLRKSPTDPDRRPFLLHGQGRNRVIAVTLTILFFVVFINRLGYVICSAGLMSAILRILGLRSWVQAFVIAILASLISYYLFARLLGVPLPMGSLFS